MPAARIAGDRGSLYELPNLTGIQIERNDFGRLRGRGPNREKNVFSTGEDFGPTMSELTAICIAAWSGPRADRLQPLHATIHRLHPRK